MTDAIRENDGVVVDYAGDGFMAIWNAPSEQSNHAAWQLARLGHCASVTGRQQKMGGSTWRTIPGRDRNQYRQCPRR